MTAEGPADYSGPAPRLPIDEALVLLRQPFRILVEDGQNDRAFLLCMSTVQQRSFLEEHGRLGNLEFEHGGGLVAMRRRIADLGARNAANLLTFVLFDSDALRPDSPSVQSEAAREACLRARLPHHQLRRRFAESYLPRQALDGWASLGRGSSECESRRKRVQAFCEFPRPEQRHHFNLKKGFAGDKGRGANGETTGGLYHDVAESLRQALQHGLGRTLAEELYSPPGERVVEAHLIDDGGWSEVNPVVTAIIASFR